MLKFSNAQIHRNLSKFSILIIVNFYDKCCIKLILKINFEHIKCLKWSLLDEKFVNRVDFNLITTLSVSGKKIMIKIFEKFLPTMKEY
jgi:hypothetical protein